MITLGVVTQGSGGFKCSATSCYSYNSPATDQLFRRLQDLLNKAAARAGVSGSITVDGAIGLGTLNLAHRVSDKVGTMLPFLFSLNLNGEGWTIAALSRHADVIVPELANYVGQMPTTTPDTTQLPSGLPVDPWAYQSQTTAPYPPSSAFPNSPIPPQNTAPAAGIQTTYTPPPVTFTVAPSKKPLIIGGIVGVAGLVGVLALTMRKKKGF